MVSVSTSLWHKCLRLLCDALLSPWGDGAALLLVTQVENKGHEDLEVNSDMVHCG